MRSFLLKTYLENHKLKVDGKVDHHISMPINTMMQCVIIVTKAIQKENSRDQRKVKIATLAIYIYASILMCLRSKAGMQQNLYHPSKRDYKTL